MNVQTRILGIFFLQSIALGAWLPRIPEIQDKLALDNAGLAIALLGAPAGILTTLLFAGRFVAHVGARQTIIIFYPVFLFAMLLPLIAPSLPLIFIALMLSAGTLSVLEVGCNVVADQVEKKGKKFIMSKAHGFWSLGLMAGSLMGSWAAGLHIPPIVVGIAIALVVLPIAIPMARALPQYDNTPNEEQIEKKPGFSIPHPILLGVCFFTFGITLTEGAIADWAAVFMRDIHASGPGMAGLGVTLFALAVALTRLFGDRLKFKFGPAPLARALALTGVLGVAIIFFAPNSFVAVAGFALVGVGASLGFPLAVTAAAEAPGPSPAQNVAVMTFIALLGFLIGPVSIGFIAQTFDIRFGLLILAPMLTLSALLAPLLRPRKT